MTISNVTYTGANGAAGTFAGGTGIIGFEGGIALSSGAIANVVGPNTTPDVTTENLTSGDLDLNSLLTGGLLTQDAAVLEFDFVPVGSTVTFNYVFASDEYNEFVNTQFNDVFAFYVNGTNCATVGSPAVPVSINTINNGDPFGTTPNSHPELYINNDLQDPPGGNTLDTEMDGLTTVLTCESPVNPGVTNHMKLAVADTSDGSYDTNVFLQAGSLTTAKSTSTTYTGDATVQYSDPATLSGTLLDTSVTPSVGIAGKQLDFTVGTQTASATPTDANGNASTPLVVTQEPGSVTSVATAFAGDAAYAPSNDTDPFTVTKEDCTLTYAGDTTVASGLTANLAADLGESDSSLGDRSNKSVTLNVTDSASNTQSFIVSTDASGRASKSVSLLPGVYNVSASFAGDTFYNSCSSTTADVRVQGAPPTFSISLSPPSASNNVGQEHCVTATVTGALSAPAANVQVPFTVTGANSASRTQTTSVNGEATFCYTGTNVGDDTISAFADTDGNTTLDTGEPSAQATKTWIEQPAVGLPCEIEGDGDITAANGDEASFRIDVESGAQPKGKVRFRDDGPTSPLKVKSTEITDVQVSSDGSAATITGQATVNGEGSVGFRVDVKQTAGGPTTFRIRLDSGYDSGEQQVGDGDDDAELDIDCSCEIHGRGEIEAANGDEARFRSRLEAIPAGGKLRYKDRGPADRFKLKSTEITEVLISTDGNQANIRGKGTVDGDGLVDFRVDVKDLPHAPDTFHIRLDNGYDTGEQTIDEGDVDVECAVDD